MFHRARQPLQFVSTTLDSITVLMIRAPRWFYTKTLTPIMTFLTTIWTICHGFWQVLSLPVGTHQNHNGVSRDRSCSSNSPSFRPMTWMLCCYESLNNVTTNDSSIQELWPYEFQNGPKWPADDFNSSLKLLLLSSDWPVRWSVMQCWKFESYGSPSMPAAGSFPKPCNVPIKTTGLASLMSLSACPQNTEKSKIAKQNKMATTSKACVLWRCVEQRHVLACEGEALRCIAAFPCSVCINKTVFIVWARENIWGKMASNNQQRGDERKPSLRSSHWVHNFVY